MPYAESNMSYAESNMLYANFEIDSEIMLNKHNYTKLIWRENTDHMTITCVMFCEKDGGERHS